MAGSSIIPVHPVNQWHSTNASIKRPRDLAHFSFDDDHKLHIDSDVSLRYYYPSATGVSLSNGLSSFKKWEETDEHLDALLLTIAAYEERHGCKVEADIITWRGMLTKLMTLPYNIDDTFEMNVMVYQGQIFIEEDYGHRVAAREAQKKSWTPGRHSQEEMTYWGYKFETLMTLPKPWGEATREEIEGRDAELTSNMAQYGQIVETGLGDIKLVIGGEVDAVWDVRRSEEEQRVMSEDGSLAPVPDSSRTKWVELKTSAKPKHDGQARRFESKLCKFWAQSYLLGVPTIVVGFRDDHGVLREVRDFQTSQLPNLVGQRSRSWSNIVCINFLKAVLEEVKKVVKEGGIWKIKHAKGAEVEIFRALDSDSYNFLAKEFVAWRNQFASSTGNTDRANEA